MTDAYMGKKRGKCLLSCPEGWEFCETFRNVECNMKVIKAYVKRLFMSLQLNTRLEFCYYVPT